MSDFLNGLERDLVAAMERYERTPAALRLPRIHLRRLAPVVVAATCLLAAVFAVRYLPGSRDDVAVRPPAAPLLPTGTYTRDAGAYKIVVTASSYQLLRCGKTDCGFDIFGGGLGGNEPRVRTGRLSTIGDRLTFSRDATCTRGGQTIPGSYDVIRARDIVRFRRVTDACAGRAKALTAAAWKLGR